VGQGADAGKIVTGNLLNWLVVVGDIVGGFVECGGNLNRLNMGGSIRGGDAPFAGSVTAVGTIDVVSIGKSIIAGLGDDSGVVFSEENINSVKLGADLDGSGGLKLSDDVQVGPGSGRIAANGDLGDLQILGSILGGNNDNTGCIMADYDLSGDGNIGKLLIAGAIRGGYSWGGIAGQVVTNSGYVQAVNIGDFGGPVLNDVDVGAVSAGVNNGADLFNSGAIRATGNIDSILIRGLLHGNLRTRPVISALGDINSLVIKGDCLYADILVGYGTDVYVAQEPSGDLDALNRPVNGVFLLDSDTGLSLDTSDGAEFNGSSTLGNFTAGLNYISSNLLISVDPGDDTVVGTSDDAMNFGVLLNARINNVVRGTTVGRQVFTFVLAADTITRLSGRATAGMFSASDATDISVDQPFNILTHKPLDFTTDTSYFLLYT
jgi:hypothetical protein